MKKLLPFLILLVAVQNSAAQQAYTVCPGATQTITISNTWGLTNLSHTLFPGAITSPGGVWTVTVQAPGTYTMFITGTDSNNSSVTYSATANFSHFPVPNLTTVQSPQNFTVGCNSKSVATIAITQPPPSFMAIVYTVVPAGFSPTVISGWSSASNCTVGLPGKYHALAAYIGAGTGLCWDTVSFTVAHNKVTPVFDSIKLSPSGFNCIMGNGQQVQIWAFTKGTTLLWTKPSGFPTYASPNTALAVYQPGNYSVTTFDAETDCEGDTVINVADNRVYPVLNADPSYTICNTPSIALSAHVTGGTAAISWVDMSGTPPYQEVGTGGVLVVFGPGIYNVNATNSLGCRSTKVVTVYECVGVAENSRPAFRIWPNPVIHQLTIVNDKPDAQEFRLLNALGEVLLRFNVSGETTVECSALPPGVYLLSDGTRTARFFKE